jgi:hypothetical protein
MTHVQLSRLQQRRGAPLGSAPEQPDTSEPAERDRCARRRKGRVTKDETRGA